MTVEIFDVDHEANPTLWLYPWLWQTQFTSWMSVTFLRFWLSVYQVFCISVYPYFPLGNTGQSRSQSISKGALVLSAQFWVYSVSPEVLDKAFLFCWWFSSL